MNLAKYHKHRHTVQINGSHICIILAVGQPFLLDRSSCIVAMSESEAHRPHPCGNPAGDLPLSVNCLIASTQQCDHCRRTRANACANRLFWNCRKMWRTRFRPLCFKIFQLLVLIVVIIISKIRWSIYIPVSVQQLKCYVSLNQIGL